MAGHRPSGWEIIEEESFQIGVAGLGGSRFVDEALQSLTASLLSNPLGFPEIPGFPDIRIAKTNVVISVVLIPALVVRFRVDDRQRKVFLLHIERRDPDDIRDEFDD
ncbi:hypothetical protein [Hyphomonas sp. GM-8P]|uniref:hypothetical protein n=1 Tax=Hyphomonas sp. GM-8P TaxID=1280945 RepID=UPI000DBF49B7|nr:hypothetical protein [Hyphomonas sp. GM-8P]RAN36784.1 hypothetical protein HY26_07175 [Hyphomonas sp. GM-8P]